MLSRMNEKLLNGVYKMAESFHKLAIAITMYRGGKRND